MPTIQKTVKFDDTFYAVFLRGTPISLHRYPQMALIEARERSVAGAKASVVAMKPSYYFGEEPDGQTFFEFSDPTNPGCSLCAHEGSHDER